MPDAVTAVLDWAREVGFENVGPLDATTLEVRHDLRMACIRNLCGHYGRTSACPAECGELHAYEERFRAFTHGILVQTSRPVHRDAGLSELLDVGREHGRRMRLLAGRVSAALPNAWALSGGECDACTTCDLPSMCSEPELQLVSMEAAGLNVAEVCARNGLPLDLGGRTLTWVGCVLVD